MFIQHSYSRIVFPVRLEVAIIIVSEEIESHQFVHGEESSTTYPKILPPPTIHQDLYVEGSIVI